MQYYVLKRYTVIGYLWISNPMMVRKVLSYIVYGNPYITFTEYLCLIWYNLTQAKCWSPLVLTVASWSARCRLKSPVSWLFAQLFVKAQTKKKHQSSASLAFVMGNGKFPSQGPVTRKMFPLADVIMVTHQCPSSAFSPCRFFMNKHWTCIKFENSSTIPMNNLS